MDHAHQFMVIAEARDGYLATTGASAVLTSQKRILFCVKTLLKVHQPGVVEQQGVTATATVYHSITCCRSN